MGALKLAQPALGPVSPLAQHETAIVVVGAHLAGLPLNGELRALGGRMVDSCETAADYRLYALSGTNPAKPGLLRVESGKGHRIAVEVWALPTEAFGGFVAAVPSPLSIGTIALADGRRIKGFLVEAEAIASAQDISTYGGWRAFLAKR